MQSFTALPPWPQSIALPVVLFTAGTSLVALLSLWSRDRGHKELIRLPLIAGAVTVFALVALLLTAIFREREDTAGVVIFFLYLLMGCATCLAYEGSAVILNNTHSFKAFIIWREVRPSMTLPLAAVGCGVYVSVKPDGIYRTSLAYLIINCVFGLLHALQIFLTFRTMMTTPFEGKEKDNWTKTKHAVSWFVKGFRMAMVQIWRYDHSTRMHGVSFLIFARCWAACCIDVALTVEFGLSGSPWILQVAPCTSIISSLLLSTLYRGRRSESEPPSSETWSIVDCE